MPAYQMFWNFSERNRRPFYLLDLNERLIWNLNRINCGNRDPFNLQEWQTCLDQVAGLYAFAPTTFASSPDLLSLN